MNQCRRHEKNSIYIKDAKPTTINIVLISAKIIEVGFIGIYISPLIYQTVLEISLSE